MKQSGIACLTAERQSELKGHCADLVRRAVLTLKALPDHERGWLSTNLRSCMPTPVVHYAEAYKVDEFDQTPERRRFRPTPKDRSRYLEILKWLTWLELQGPNDARDVKIIFAWANGVAPKTLAGRYGRSDDTIRRWMDGAFAKLTARFWQDVDRLS